MSKSLIFATHFPDWHPRSGQPTDFADKILTGQKFTTVRGGNHWKEGEFFMPIIWKETNGKLKKHPIRPMLKIVNVYSLTVDISNRIFVNGIFMDEENLIELAKIDGLNVPDFRAWVQHKRPFYGQLISWKALWY